MIYIFAGYYDEPEPPCIGFESDLATAVRVAQIEVKKHNYVWWYLGDKYMDEIPLREIPLFLFRKG